jgi:hypothetical protein
LLLHPLDVLESRLQNLLSLPQKRDEAGIAQANLAIAVAGSEFQTLRWPQITAAAREPLTA